MYWNIISSSAVASHVHKHRIRFRHELYLCSLSKLYNEFHSWAKNKQICGQFILQSTILHIQQKFFFSQPYWSQTIQIRHRFRTVYKILTLNLYLLHIWLYSPYLDAFTTDFPRILQSIYLIVCIKFYHEKDYDAAFFVAVALFHFHTFTMLMNCTFANVQVPCAVRAFAVIYTTIHKHQAKSLHRAYIWACPNKTE